MNYLNVKNKAYTKGSIKFSDPDRSITVRRPTRKRSTVDNTRRANELLKTISRIKATR